MRLFELSRPTLAAAHAVLKNAGYRQLGRGSYASVFQKPNAHYVLKLFSSDDKAYLAYLNLIRQHQDNPHFPKVFGKIIKVTNEYYAIRLEELSGFRGDKNLIDSLLFYIKYRDLTFNEPYEIFEKAKRVLEKIPDLLEAADLIADHLAPYYQVDLFNVRNVMQRGDTLVLTDPVAPK